MSLDLLYTSDFVPMALICIQTLYDEYIHIPYLCKAINLLSDQRNKLKENKPDRQFFLLMATHNASWPPWPPYHDFHGSVASLPCDYLSQMSLGSIF